MKADGFDGFLVPLERSHVQRLSSWISRLTGRGMAMKLSIHRTVDGPGLEAGVGAT